jgi:hypothetical protein
MRNYFCKVCGVTDPSMFYAAVQSNCKEHWKLRVNTNRAANIDYYRAFDLARANSPERVSARKAYIKTPEGKKAKAKANLAWLRRNRDKMAAHNATSRAILKGTLVRQPCEVCGNEKSEAHHDDYSKPLDVRWLCSNHHRMVHGKL